ncbi:MAG: hypothetical protein WCC89_11630 [Candidatus Sulfotelmatobacter sp.]|jgi:hypothetical protein
MAAAFLGWFLFVRIPPPEPGSGARQDPFCRKLLDTKTHQEALAWVKESKNHDVRAIGEQSPEESLNIVERLYQEGSERVWVVDLEIYPNEGQSTNKLVIELPTDPKLRRKIFLLEARVAASGGFDPVSDDGQHYMFLYKFKLPFHL